MSTLYADIMNRYGFSIPEPYRKLEKRGLFHTEEPVYYLDCIEPGSGYLWLNDMEWYTPEEILDFEFEEYHIQEFVPFAFTAGGDYWCWQPGHASSAGERVVLCPHDSDTAEVYAPDFSAALYRQILNYACYGVSDPDDLSIPRAFLRRWHIDLACIFPKPWCERMSQIMGSSPKTWKEFGFACGGLLTPEELLDIEQQDIGYAEIGHELQWMKP